MNEELQLQEDEDSVKKTRFKWLDQFRGFCVLLYTIAIISWALSKDVQLGDFPLFPTYLNHGWAISFSTFGNIPQEIPVPITLIDIGQGVLMFLVGLMQSYSFRRRVIEFNKRNAWMHALNRFTIFLGLSVIFEDVILGYGIFFAVFDGVFAIISWATLFSAIATSLFKKPWNRILSGAIILIIHYILYSIPSIREWNVNPEGIWYFSIPWRMINVSAIAIIASGIGSFLFSDQGEVIETNFAKIILPLAIGSVCSSIILDFFQFANSIVCNTPLALLALGVGLIFMFLFYSFEKINFKIPGFSSIGRNMMFFFLFSPIFEWLLVDLFEIHLSPFPFLILLVYLILPVCLIFFIAFILNRKRIVFKI